MYEEEQRVREVLEQDCAAASAGMLVGAEKMIQDQEDLGTVDRWAENSAASEGIEVAHPIEVLRKAEAVRHMEVDHTVVAWGMEVETRASCSEERALPGQEKVEDSQDKSLQGCAGADLEVVSSGRLSARELASTHKRSRNLLETAWW